MPALWWHSTPAHYAINYAGIFDADLQVVINFSIYSFPVVSKG